MIILLIGIIGITLGQLFNDYLPSKTKDGQIGSMIVGLVSALLGYTLAQKYYVVTGDFASQFLLLAISIFTASIVLFIRSYTSHSFRL